MIFTGQKIVFSVDAQQLKNGNMIFFQSLNHVDINLKLRFLIKSGYYIVPSSSTALAYMVQLVLLVPSIHKNNN